MGYHLLNVLLHSITSLCYFLLIRGLTFHWTAFFSALLFATHPIHCEAVAGVVGRADILAGLFFFLSLLVYMNCCQSCSLTGCLFSLLLAGLSMLCKEQGITVLAVCAVYDVFVSSRCQLNYIFSILFDGRFSGLRLRFFILFAGGITLLSIRVALMGNKPPDFAPSDNPAADSEHLLTRILTFNFLPAFNTWLLLSPATLSFDWSMQAIPVLESLSDARNVVSIVFYCCLVLLADVCLASVSGIANYKGIVYGRLQLLTSATEKSVEKRDKNFEAKSVHDNSVDCLVLSLSLMVFPFLPATNFLFYVGFVVAERILYIPSAGFCLLVALGAEKLWMSATTKAMRKVILMGVLSVLLLFIMRTVRRNEDWQNEESLYRSGISVNPAKAWGNLANVLKGSGRTDEAEAAYRNALSYRPNMADAHYNLGILLQEGTRYQEAIVSYNNAVKFRPTLASAHLNLGIVLEEVNEKKEAEKVFRHCITIPDEGLKDPKAHAHAVTSCKYNLGRLLHRQGRNQESVDIYMYAINNLPLDYAPQSLYNMLGQTLTAMNRFQEAEMWYNKALVSKPDHMPAHLTLAELYAKTDRVDSARKLFEKAIELQPAASDPYTHYGHFLRGLGDLSTAATQFGKAADIAPDNFDIVFNAGNICREAQLYGDAEMYYRKALKLNSQSAGVNMNLGALLHLLKRYEEAETYYNAALKLQPGDTLTIDNLRKLKQVMQKQSVS
ncbi:protein O-mannosyl-transferase TMTC2-like isoform X2 [Corticium candelabrum]|nr:protein O-mannosyl-transferase TMTC2-like isoform X2 [Corticium candelabrum]